MLVNIIQNTISSFISAGISVITTNLKMWLGFETSETLGREEVVNGDFATDLSSWDISGTDATHTVTYSNQSARYESDNVTPQLNFDQTISNVEVGKTYQLSIDVTYTTGTLKVVTISGVALSLEDGLNVFSVVAANNTIRITRSANIVDALINSVSLKELTQYTPDKSGNNNVGELFTGKAIEFDGNNDYVEVPNSTSLNVGTDDFTYCFWVYIGSAKSQRIIDKRNTKGFTFYIDVSNVLRLELNDGTTNIGFVLGTLTLSVWQRVVVSADRDGNAICYINGVAQTPVDISSKSGDLTDTTSLFIGADAPNGEALNFDGFITDIQWYDTILSQADVTYDYANPNKLAIDNPSTSLSVTNLKAYWALSEGDGLVAYDSGTNLEEEEVVDGDFPLPNNNWTLQSAWSISNNKALYDDSTESNIVQNGLSVSAGKTYQISFDISDCPTSSGLQIYFGAGGFVISPFTYRANDSYVITFTPSTNQSGLTFKGFVDGDTFSLSNVSLKEITASDHGGIVNGATYVDAQPRIPQLGMMNWSKGSNLFPYSEDFTKWVISTSTSQVLLAQAEAAPYGQGDVYSILMQSSEAAPYIRYATTNATLTSSTHSVWVKQAPTGSATHIRITNNDRTAWNTGTSKKIALTSSWQRIETTDAITGNRFTIIGATDASEANDSDCIGKALIYGAQLVEGSSAGAYRFTDGGATSNSTVIPNPTIPTKDIFGNAVRDRLNSFNLDGSGYATNETLPTISGNISLSFWVKLDTFVSGNLGQILGKREGSSWLRVYRPYASHLRLEVAAGQQYTFSVTENQWVYVAITINSSNQVSVYVDDSAASGATLNTSFSFINTEVFTVGAWLNPALQPTSKLNGLVSDVLIYDRVLTSDEVENNYNAGLSAHTN